MLLLVHHFRIEVVELAQLSTEAKEALNKSPNEMKGKAHGAQKARHNVGLGELASTAQRSHSLVKVFMQCFPEAQCMS